MPTSTSQQVVPPENAVRAQFSGSPTLESVTQQLLADAIAQQYPSLVIDLDHTRLATPQPMGGWTLEPFMARVKQFLGSGTDLDFSPIYGESYYLSDQHYAWLTLQEGELDMKVIEKLVKELAWRLPIGLQDALNEFWGQDCGAGGNRWSWLSDVIKDTQTIRALQQPDLNKEILQAISQVINAPVREDRIRLYQDNAVRAYWIKVSLISAGVMSSGLSARIALATRDRVFVFQPNGRTRTYKDIDALSQSWSAGVKRRYAAEEIRLTRFELEGNVFEASAAAILNQQLERIGLLNLPASIGWQALDNVYRDITDTAALFEDSPQANLDTLETLKTQLPDWLANASPGDQALYRQYSLSLSATKKINKGQTYLYGITDLHTYAVDVLREQMRADQLRLELNTDKHVSDAVLDPEALELTFTTATGLPDAVGIIESTAMSLTELALNNLKGRPKGSVRLRHRYGLTLPDWLTTDYITRRNGLIEQVNIGKAYPERLEDLLLSSSALSTREKIFAEHLSAQLPLEALEHSLKKENGVTAQGARYVAALVQPGTSDRVVDENIIVIRHLALVRKHEALPDVVANMFIIEPQDVEQGPHLLYRPFYAQSLLEYPTRAALLDAIAQPGELQKSVLTWLSDRARPVYDYGGFKEPHIVHFTLGDEFAPIDTPAPAQLATNGTSNELMQYLANGQLMLFLYGSNARGLVEQANAESVSNSESRWAVLLEGASLIFNSLLLLPELPRPLMLTAGLKSLAELAVRNIPALASPDKAVRENAAADVLINLSLLLFHPILDALPRLTKLPPGLKSSIMRPFAPPHFKENWPASPPPLIDAGLVALPGVFPNTESTPVDFSFASARNQLTPSQRERLAGFKVTPPQPLPPAQASGLHKGLYRFDDKWHVLIGEDLFPVDVDPSGAAVIVSASDISLYGPGVKPDGRGKWSLDLRLRLQGGMPPRRIASRQRENEARILELRGELNDFYAAEESLFRKVKVTSEALQSASADLRFPRAQIASLRERLNTALQEQLNAYLKMLNTTEERIRLHVPFTTSSLNTLLEKAFNNRVVALYLSSLERKALTDKWPQFSTPGPELDWAGEDDPQGFNQFLHELISLNGRAIERVEKRNSLLDELFNQGPSGVTSATPLLEEIYREGLTPLSLKAVQLSCLKLASTKIRVEIAVEESLDHTIDPLQEHVQTHNELNVQTLDSHKRLEVLDSLVENYGQALDALHGIRIVNAEDLEPEYFNKLVQLLTELYQDARTLLAAEIKPEPKARKKPRSRPSSGGTPKKKVISVKGRGKLIGEIKPAGKDWPIEVIEIRDGFENKLLSTYSQHGDEWREIKEAVRPVAAPSRALSLIKGEARKLYRLYDENLFKAREFQKLCRYPVEIEELFTNEGKKLDKLATEMDVAMQSIPAESRRADDVTLVDNMRTAARNFFSEGKAFRTQLSRELPPTHSNLQYLLGENLVQIAGLGKRIKLQGPRQDFIQEYAVNDRGGFTLWYAHFHYAEARTPKLDFDVAHLKTKEQRKLSYYSQLADARSEQAVVDVHYGRIGKELAERWFLPLAGDE